MNLGMHLILYPVVVKKMTTAMEKMIVTIAVTKNRSATEFYVNINQSTTNNEIEELILKYKIVYLAMGYRSEVINLK